MSLRAWTATCLGVLLVWAFVSKTPALATVALIGAMATFVYAQAATRPMLALPLAIALALRILTALAEATFHFLPDASLDAVAFRTVAEQWSGEGWARLPSHLDPGAYVYSWLLALLFLAFGTSELLASIVNVGLGGATVTAAYFLARELWGPAAARNAAWAIALWPTLILYSVLTLRESLITALFSWGALFAARWHKSGRLVEFCIAGLLVVAAGIFHTGMLLALPALALAAAVRTVLHAVRGQRRAALRSGVALAAPLALVMLIVLTGGASLDNVGSLEALSLDVIEVRASASQDARSAYLLNLTPESWWDVAWQEPIRLAYFFFSPVPWDVNAAKDLLGMADAALYLAVAVALVRRRASLRDERAALILLLAITLVASIFALNTFNAGTAVRHRAKLAPILFALVPPAMLALPSPRGGGGRLMLVINEPATFFPSRGAIASAAQRAGYAVSVAGPPGPAVERIRSAGLAYHEVPMGRKSLAPMGELRTLLALRRLYATERPSVVHHFTVKPIVYGGLAARLAGVPRSVSTVTGLGYVFIQDTPRPRLLRPLVATGYALALGGPHCVPVFQNADDRSLLAHMGAVDARRATIVPGSGVDLERFRVRPEPDTGQPVVVLPARMLADKGIREFVDAARILRARGVAVRMALVGEADPGNPASISEEALEAWASEGSVERWGHREDMPEVFSQAHIVCLPSYREGVPRVLLEAGASARAAVAADVPGCRDVIEHAVTGLLVPPRDASALADAIARLAQDADLRARMGRKARERVAAHFSVERVQALTLETYAGAPQTPR